MEDYYSVFLRCVLLFGIFGSLCLCQQPLEKQFQCPEQFGYYSDTEDCSKYFVCVFGDALHESCTGGLHFSVELQTCDWPRNVDCPFTKPSAGENPAPSGSPDNVFSSNRRPSPSSVNRGASRPGNAVQGRSAAGSRAGSRYRNDDEDGRPGGVSNTRTNQLRPPSTWEPPSTLPTTVQSTTSTTSSASSPTIAATEAFLPTTTAVSIYHDHPTDYSLEPETSTPTSKETQLEADNESSSAGDAPSSNRFPGYDPQQPQFDEAVPPVVDSEGRIHIPDGIYSNGPHNPGEDISVFVKPIFSSTDLKGERNEHGQADSRYSPPQHESHAPDNEDHQEQHKEPDPILELTNNNGQSSDPDLVSRYYHPRAQPQSTGRDRTTAVLQLYRSNPRPQSPNPAYRTQKTQSTSLHQAPVQDSVHYETPRHYDSNSYRKPEQDQPTSYAEPQSEGEYSNPNQSPRYVTEDVSVHHTNNGSPRDPDVNGNRQDSRFSRVRGSRQGRVLPVDRVRTSPETFASPSREQVPKAQSQHYGYETQRDFNRYPQATEAPQTDNLEEDSRKPYSDYASLPYGYSDQYDDPNKQNVFVARPRTSATRTSRPRTTSTTTTTTTTTTTAAPPPPPPRTIVRRPPPAPRPVSRTPSNEPRPAEKLPSRPAPVYATPEPFTNAQRCSPRTCKLPDCRCGGSDIPGGLPSNEVPQVVLITFDDAINDLNYDLYEDLFGPRQNPNGCPILGTFYVSHEWTDYGKVQTLYSKGHEMASHSVTHSYGEKFSKTQWMKEIHGQREILNLYGGVKAEDVRGMRAPFLQIGGNKMFEMLYESNFTYDSSMPVFENNPPFWPYTLDYAINNECMITPCPTKAFPGIWEIGMVMWVDLRGGRCSMGDACSNPNDDEGVYKMLIKNFNRHYKGNRAPFGLYYHSAWFSTQHHRKGFMRFLDEINSKNDVWFINNWQLIQWLRNPTPLSKINNFEPWQCNPDPTKPPVCRNPTVCNVWSAQGGVRYMKTCQPCPTKYPWVGKTS